MLNYQEFISEGFTDIFINKDKLIKKIVDLYRSFGVKELLLNQHGEIKFKRRLKYYDIRMMSSSDGTSWFADYSCLMTSLSEVDPEEPSSNLIRINFDIIGEICGRFVDKSKAEGGHSGFINSFSKYLLKYLYDYLLKLTPEDIKEQKMRERNTKFNFYGLTTDNI